MHWKLEEFDESKIGCELHTQRIKFVQASYAMTRANEE